jgi:hypothetical protein
MTNAKQEALINILLGIGESCEISKDDLNKVNELVMNGEFNKTKKIEKVNKVN